MFYNFARKYPSRPVFITTSSSCLPRRLQSLLQTWILSAAVSDSDTIHPVISFCLGPNSPPFLKRVEVPGICPQISSPKLRPSTGLFSQFDSYCYAPKFPRFSLLKKKNKGKGEVFVSYINTSRKSSGFLFQKKSSGFCQRRGRPFSTQLHADFLLSFSYK